MYSPRMSTVPQIFEIFFKKNYINVQLKYFNLYNSLILFFFLKKIPFIPIPSWYISTPSRIRSFPLNTFYSFRSHPYVLLDTSLFLSSTFLPSNNILLVMYRTTKNISKSKNLGGKIKEERQVEIVSKHIERKYTLKFWYDPNYPKTFIARWMH